jgi:hypothetical protein
VEEILQQWEEGAHEVTTPGAEKKKTVNASFDDEVEFEEPLL